MKRLKKLILRNFTLAKNTVIHQGDRVGRLTVSQLLGSTRNWHRVWRCHCDCGNDVDVFQTNLVRKHTLSCGCFHQELRESISLRHGDCRKGYESSEHIAWLSMIGRCENIKNNAYGGYGGRGIKVCTRWRNSYENFLTDMGRRPSSQHSLDRINNDGNYEPGNCRWATRQVQNRNRRDTIKEGGVCLRELAENAGIGYTTIYRRHKRGDQGSRLLRPV